MIVAERKPMEEILRLIDGAKTVLLTGCGGCVTVHMAGGEKEVEVLASLLRLHYKKEDKPIEILTQTVTRQCEPEYVRELANNVDKAAVVLSMGCGVGVQFIAENFPKAWVVPALNTKFAGATLEAGVWAERCGLCGECILYKTGGICPVIRCSKSLLNGPCGGSQNGKCEVDPEIDCAWQLIHDRMKDLGKLDLLLEIEPPKDWSKARDGGPRKVMREDMRF